MKILATLFLQHNPKQLKELYLSETCIGDLGVKALAEAILEPRMQRNEDNTATSSWCCCHSLVTIDLRHNGIGNIGARSIAKAILNNTTLNRLYVQSNEFGIEGFQHILNSVEWNNTLCVLCINNFEIYSGRIRNAIAMNQRNGGSEKLRFRRKKMMEWLCANWILGVNCKP